MHGDVLLDSEDEIGKAAKHAPTQMFGGDFPIAHTIGRQQSKSGAMCALH